MDSFSYTNSSGSTVTMSLMNEIVAGEGITPNQQARRTYGNDFMSYDLGGATGNHAFVCKVPASVTAGETDLSDILRFFGPSYVNYSQNAFSWTDHLSTLRTVNYVGSLNWQYTGPDEVTVSWMMEEGQ